MRFQQWMGAIVLCWPLLAWSQTGVVKVRVADTISQRPLTDARVTLTRVKSKRVQSSANTPTQPPLSTDDSGVANFQNLPSGLYQLSVKRTGYSVSRLPSIRVVSGRTTPVNVRLNPAQNAIEEVLVVGSQVGSRRLGPVSAGLMDRENLRSAAGSGSDVLRALDGMPGLFSDGEFSSYTVRGNGPRNNLILVDGIPFDRVVHFGENFGDLDELEGGGRYSVFAPNLIASAEFQPGGWQAAYGGQAGSLLQLEVAEGNAETSTYTARLDLAGLEVGYDGPSGVRDDTSVLFSVRHLDFGQLFQTIGIEDLGEPVLTDVILKTHTELSSGDTLQFLTIVAPESFDRDVSHALASDEDNPGNFEDLSLVDSEADNILVATTWNHLLGDTGELAQRWYYRRFAEDSVTGEALVDNLPANPTADNVPVRFPILFADRSETEWGWRLDFSQDNALGRLQTGFRVTHLALDFNRRLTGDWNRYVFEQEDFRPNNAQKFIVLTPEQFDSAFARSGLQMVGFIDQEYNWGDWEFRTGVRYERDRLIEDEAISPRFAATWQGDSPTRVTFTAGRYVQLPRFVDLASDANNTLGFEQNDQISVGVKFRLAPSVDLFIEPYYQWLSDRVVRQDGVNQTFANSGSGRSYGVDTAITRYFDGDWSANATYSYNQAEVKDTPDGEVYDADFSRPHAFSVGGVWEINERWKISGRWKWASGRPFGDFIIHDNVLGDGELTRFSKEITTNNTERYGNFNALNFRIDYRRALRSAEFIAFFDVINFLGADNPSSAEFNERTGENVIEEGQSIPIIGLRMTW